MLNSIEYRTYSKRSDIHGTVLYPAVMMAPVQQDILRYLSANGKIESIFDPFHGSGTSLYEAMEIWSNIRLIGCDINPLANLITKVKLGGISDDININIETLEALVGQRGRGPSLDFPRMEKWFRSDIIGSLSILKNAIIRIDNKQDRLFFWYMLCDIIRRYSNTRSSTYKLHVKDVLTINRMVNNVITDYFSAIHEHAGKFHHSAPNYALYKCDVLDQLPRFGDESFDVTITSPPYGDNDTTVPYGQFSMLPLYIIDENDLDLEGWELDNYSRIDVRSLGGSDKPLVMRREEEDLIIPYLERISEAKRAKVVRFFNDYFVVLRQLCRVTDKYIVLNLGNRTVDRIRIDLTDITRSMLAINGFKNIESLEREIPKKRIPRITSLVNERPVSSMNNEYIIIHERIR